MSRLNMEFEKEEEKKIDTLKRKYGIKQTTELIRFIISMQYNNLLSSSSDAAVIAK
jgi:hypothetical protein